MPSFHIPLRVVFYKEDGDWIAHCLECDLIGHGATREAALECLTEAIVLQLEFSIEQDNIDNLFRPAPAEFFAKFATGKGSAVRNLQLCLERLDFADDVQLRECEEERVDGRQLAPA